MKTGAVIVADEFEPLLADDDWQSAAETMARRPINDLVLDPAINQHPFGLLSVRTGAGGRWARGRMPAWGRRAPILPTL